MITELPLGFFIQKILRAIFFSYEFKIPLTEQYLLDSARQLYLRSFKSLMKITNEEIKEIFTVKVRDKAIINNFMKHLRRAGIKTILLEVEKVNGYFKIRFENVYTRETKEMRQRLMEKSFYD